MRSVSPILIAALRAGKTIRVFPHKSVELGQLILDQRDQLAHPIAVEDQPCTGGLEQLGQRHGRPERERRAVLANCLAAISQTVPPDLKSAELRDAVLDVVEGAAKEMRLLVPARDSFRIESVPIHRWTFEAPAELEPLPVASISVAAVWVQVDPVLKCVDRCAMREEQDYRLQELDSRAVRILLAVVTAIVLVDEGRSEQFHRHRGDFGHLRAGMTLEEKGESGCLERMERVA